MTKDEALKLALEALKFNQANWRGKDNAITSIKWALAQPAQEPVAYLCKPDKHGLFDRPTPDKACEDCFPVYAAPPQPAQEPIKQVLDAEFNRGYKEGVRDAYAKSPQRPWVGLTDEELKKMVDDAGFTRTDLLMIGDCVEQLADLVEAKLKEKNT